MNKTLRWLGAVATVAILGFAVYGSTREFRKPSTDTQTSSWLNRSGSLSVWYSDERLTPYITKAAVEFGEQENITVILITHYMEEVVHADKVFVMDKGRVVMSGSPREVFSRVDEITEIGLSVPQVTLLADELKRRGADLSDGILTSEELVGEICRSLRII